MTFRTAIRLFAAGAVVFTLAAYLKHPAPEARAAQAGAQAARTGAAAAGAAGAAAAVRQEPTLPPDAEGAEARLAASPRHGEWVTIRTGPADSVRAWVVYPERATKAPVVLVVHEIFGMSNWVRAVADDVAAQGFIAVAPDLLTMKDVPTAPDGSADAQAAVAAIRTLDRDAVQRDLRAVAAWAMKLPAATQKYGIVGFCWGGTTTFAHAVAAPDLSAAVVYYGTSPKSESLARVRAPVLGLYGGADARVGATVPGADSTMKALGKVYEPHFFEDAGHGFLRQQSGRDGANMAASRQAWPLTIAWFRRYLES